MYVTANYAILGIYVLYSVRLCVSSTCVLSVVVDLMCGGKFYVLVCHFDSRVVAMGFSGCFPSFMITSFAV